MPRIKNIFFDLDHTIWDFEKNSALTFKKILNDYRLDINIDAFLKVYVPINFKYWKLYREEKITKEFLRYHRLKSAFDEFRIRFAKTQKHKNSKGTTAAASPIPVQSKYITGRARPVSSLYRCAVHQSAKTPKRKNRIQCCCVFGVFAKTQQRNNGKSCFCVFAFLHTSQIVGGHENRLG